MGGAIRAVETSRIAFGPYSLSGNGAFAVPIVLAPVAIFAGWAWLMRARTGTPAEMTLYAVGMIVGTGLGYGIVVGEPLTVLSGVLGFGPFTVLPALFAGLTIRSLGSRKLATNTAALALAFVGGALVASLPPVAFAGGLGVTGVSVGAGVVASQHASTAATVALGVALVLLAIMQAFAAPLLILPLFVQR